MKKLALLFTLPAILAACDSKPQAEILLTACCGEEEKYGDIKLYVYDDKMVLNVKGEEVQLKDTNNEGDFAAKDRYHMTLEGVIPSTKDEVIGGVTYFSERGVISYVNFDIGTAEGRVNYNSSYKVKLKNYPMPGKIETCIKEIDGLVNYNKDTKNVYVGQRCNLWRSRAEKSAKDLNNTESIRAYGCGVDVKIPTEDAIAISKNWDPNNFKIYSHFYKSPTVEEHEKDACDVLERLKKYVSDKGYDKPIDKYLDEMYCETPTKVIKLGANKVTGLSYNYIVLNICENGKHYVQNVADVYDFYRLDDRSDFLPTRAVVRDGSTVYSTYDVWHENLIEIYHSSNTDEYTVRFVGTDPNRMVKFEKLNDFQQRNACAYAIYNMTRIGADGSVEVDIKQEVKRDDDGIKFNQEFVPLTQEQALAISKNWDYKNMKLYHTGEQPHESDACEVYDVLGNFVFEQREKKEKEGKNKSE